jgi:type IX secretion system PorP/SprF family membrane protein
MKTIINNNFINSIKRLVFFSVLGMLPLQVDAQFNPMGASYFKNQYLVNPALAGMKQELNLNMGIRRDFSSIPGSPTTQNFTADYGFTPRAAIALLVYNDRAGLLRNTKGAGTFAYHLPLSAAKVLSFGISLALAKDQLDQSAVNGNLNDPDLLAVNDRETYVDGNFGLAYTQQNLSLQLAFPNMKRLFRKDGAAVAERSIFFSALSYQFTTVIGLITPKLVYRGTESNRHIFDGGANWEIQRTTPNRLNVFGMYHSTKSATFGIGMNWADNFSLNAMYNTNVAGLQNYTTGNFELNIGCTLFRK